MKQEIVEQIAKDISSSYFDVLITAYEEEARRFPITMCIIEFLNMLKEKNIVYELGDIFNSKIIDKLYVEANNYIGR